MVYVLQSDVTVDGYYAHGLSSIWLVIIVIANLLPYRALDVVVASSLSLVFTLLKLTIFSRWKLEAIKPRYTHYVRTADVKSTISERIPQNSTNTRCRNSLDIKRQIEYQCICTSCIATFTPEKVKDGCDTSTR